jgi:hypothetical protein
MVGAEKEKQLPNSTILDATRGIFDEYIVEGLLIAIK